MNEQVAQALGALSRGISSESVHRGLAMVVLRLVVLLHVRDERLLALIERLGGPGAEGLDRRHDAWADLLALFRAVFSERRTPLFDPDEHPFLESLDISDAAVATVLRGLPRVQEIEQLGSIHEVLQPSEQRRRSGAHYTPRSLTEPVVRATLQPQLDALGPAPTQEQVLGLKVCDPAMGSGAFLLETCRQLSEQLLQIWQREGRGEDPGLARRLVAQRCLYGVDKDPIAVELAKLSLWSLVGVEELPFSFMDHALKCGDALVASRRPGLEVQPFDWEVEFASVFERKGFCAIVGNPPYMKGGAISGTLGSNYLAYLLALHPGTHGNADLVSHFVLRAFALLRPGGTLGLLTTNTIYQGDTRTSSLALIHAQGGTIYHAHRRIPWPGTAAVLASMVCIHRGAWTGPRELDGRPVDEITTFLADKGPDSAPQRLRANAGLSFSGPKPYGIGFVFDDDDKTGKAPSLALMREIVAKSPHSANVIAPLLKGQDITSLPTLEPRRFIINLGEPSEAEARRAWPELMALLERTVKLERAAVKDPKCRERWWIHERTRPELHAAKAGLARVLVHPFTSQHLVFAFVPAHVVVPAPHNLFMFDRYAALAILQSRVHEVWVRFFASTLEDRLRYAATDCFETFPFPDSWQSNDTLERVGEGYHAHRAASMRQHDEGLTTTYNRFHDPRSDAPGIVQLREWHAALDRAVLDAYGWSDLAEQAVPEFGLAEGYGKKPRWRYEWSQELRDEVLARLLERNARQAARERV